MMDNTLSAKFLMEEVLKNIFPAQMFKIGELVEGVVLQKQGARIFIDLGAFGTGIIYGQEYYEAQDLVRGLKSGDKISAKVIEIQNEDGYVDLSLKEAGREMIWDELNKLKDKGEVITVKITKVNSGGLMAQIKNVPAFMPVSQLSVKNYPRVEGGDKTKILIELNKFVGKDMAAKVIDVSSKEEKLIISERGIEDEALKEIIDNFKIGDVVEGEVSGVVDFGAFVKIALSPEKASIMSHIEGLVHISELDWQLIEDPKQIIKIGDKIQAKIIGMEGDKISLSIKALKKDPWENIEETYKVGQVLKGKIVKLNPFGAFVKLDDTIQGLCHLSEFKSADEMKEKLEVGKTYQFNIQLINKEEHRMALGFGKTVKAEGKSEEAEERGEVKSEKAKGKEKEGTKEEKEEKEKKSLK